MEGTIFIRGNQITEQEEEILTKFKDRKSISANTKAIQSIIKEYDKLESNENFYKEEIKNLKSKVWELENRIEDYEEFFSLFKKLSKSKK